VVDGGLSSISDCRAVSLFDTRDKIKIDDTKPSEDRYINLDNAILTDHDNQLTDNNLNNESFTDSDSTLIDEILDDDNFINRRNTLTNFIKFIKHNNLNNDMANNSDNDAYINTDISIEKNNDINKINLTIRKSTRKIIWILN
jgi:hypothetical protein